ncbi:MAG: hypothetical protein IT304_03130 [Dehalococcoidia bacterium]|nr:hypothetical protein [Dehalococcoidia bacterium]
MADLSAPMPVEPTKSGAYLHDRSRIPAAPPSRTPLLARYVGPLAAIGFALGLFVLAVQTRDGWASHRDWVVPGSGVACVVGGLALGHLLARGKWVAVLPGLGLLLVALVMTALNVWRGQVVSGGDALRDTMSIVTAVFLGFAVAALAAALVVVEVTDPTRPPEAAAS